MALIAFTGSKEVGLDILAAAGQTPDGQAMVKKVVCEMGGKNAIIVDDSADLDEAVAGRPQVGLRLQRPEMLGVQPGDRAGRRPRRTSSAGSSSRPARW